jgi:hypothetical protein
VSTFRKDIEVTLDGEVFKCQTRAIDYTNAERQLVHDGGKVAEADIALRFRIAYCVFRRDYPEHPAAKAYGVFLDVLDDINETPDDADEGDPLDPTPWADTGG